MSLVSVHNEWDPLEEVIIGTAVDARIPRGDVSMRVIEYADAEEDADVPSGPHDDYAIRATEQELAALCEQLTALGVTVRRPAPRDHSVVAGTPDWSTDSFPDYCPRDGFLTIGSTIIETPMPLRSRYFEFLAYKDLFLEYFASGARWVAAPKPRLSDALYDTAAPVGGKVRDLEPCFDAANVLRLGTDLLYLVSDSGNELGSRWLQSFLGDTYTVHPVRNVYASTHIDTTFVPLRPGLVLCNSERVTAENMPEVLRSWDHVFVPPPRDLHPPHLAPNGSIWVGMNMLSINPNLVVVDRRQTELIAQLEGYGMDVLPAQLTHARTFGGGFHCASLDVRRTGTLETYS
jgi:scyllo-inosamine-4-phosphate amidinotransferase 1